MQNIYMALTLVSIVTALMMLFWPESEKRKAQEAEEKAMARANDEEEEEFDKDWELLGQMIFVFPAFTAITLASYKSSFFLGNISKL